ncbi:MAG TPA: PhnD/SsuA/transferrin family substrate-binding protein [Myxococcaceae bacterium]|nr:PhnD/SsuA/transferrin family substrate-binding protein [Myxococcaceae bacterium]
MSSGKPIVVGTVIYDPKVTVIWGIIRDFFEQQRQPIEVVFYSNYDLQVDGLVKRHLDVAWSSPLAWLDAQRKTGGQCRAVAMRDTDRDRVTHLVARRKSNLGSLADLRGKTVALGAKDSPQATLIPLELLRTVGLEPEKDVSVRRFDVLVGLHGDHVGGELDAFKCLDRGEAHASAMLDLNWDRWSKDGTINPEEFAVVGSTGSYDHCNFTVLADFPAARERSFFETLMAMSYDNPKHREMMDMEGLKAWLPGRTSGYGQLARAVEAQRFWSAK